MGGGKFLPSLVVSIENSVFFFESVSGDEGSLGEAKFSPTILSYWLSLLIDELECSIGKRYS